MIEEQAVVISTGDKLSYTRQTVSVPGGVVVSRKQVKQLGYYVNADCIGQVKDGAN